LTAGTRADTAVADPGPALEAAGAARGTALNIAGSAVGAVVGFVTVGLITNVWGQAGAGLFFAATGLFTLAANGARLGAESGLTYFVARFRADGEHRAVPTVIRLALVATGSAAAALAIAGVVAAPALGRLLTSDTAAQPDAEAMIRILALAVPAYALAQAMFGASRGFATMRPSVIVGQVVRPVGRLVIVLAVMATTDSVVALAVAWAATSLVTATSIGLWLRRRVARLRERNGQPAPDHRFDREYARFAAPRALADLVSAALDRLDVVLVAVLVGEAGAGLYGASGRLILAGQLTMVATAQSMAPVLTAAFSTGRTAEAQRILRTVTAWNITLLWPVFICLGFGARTALSVFGSEFGEAWPLVVVLSVGLLIVIGMGGGDTLLTTTGDSLASLLNHVVALAIMVTTAIVLLPAVGIVGAAWAWALSRVALRSLAGLRVWRTKGIHGFGRPVPIAAALAMAAYVPAGILALAVAGPGWGAVALNVAFGVATHLILLARFRAPLDLDGLVAVFRRAT
jgi:O-antigen/teichoic acid export membrane protein